MNYTQKRKINQVDEGTLVIGIDVAKDKHVARAQDFRGIEFGNPIYFVNRKHGFEHFKRWFLKLLQAHEKEEIIIGLEPTGHYWLPLFEYLEGNGFKTVTVNPHHVKKSKELDDNSPTKCDVKDAKVIAQLVKDGRYSEPNIPNGVYANIRVAVNHREKLLKDINRIQNNITRWLDMYFPEYSNVFKDWEGKASLSTLQNIPFPKQIAQKKPEEIVEIWKEAGIKRGVGIKRARKLKEAAKTSIGVSTGLDLAGEQLKHLLEQYKQLKRHIEEIRARIEGLLEKIPGAKKMLTVPGVGEITVAGFYAECGCLGNYTHPKQIVKLAGLNLQEHSSGKHKGETRITKRGRPKLRALLYRVSLPLVRHNEEFRQIHKYYTTRSKNPLEKKQSLIAICCKLIRVLYALGTKQVEYDGEKMLKDIKRPREYQKAA